MHHLTEYWVQPHTVLLKSALLCGWGIINHEANVKLQWQKLPPNQEEKKELTRLECPNAVSNHSVYHIILCCREYILHNQVYSCISTWCHKRTAWWVKSGAESHHQGLKYVWSNDESFSACLASSVLMKIGYRFLAWSLGVLRTLFLYSLQVWSQKLKMCTEAKQIM